MLSTPFVWLSAAASDSRHIGNRVRISLITKCVCLFLTRSEAARAVAAEEGTVEDGTAQQLDLAG